MRSVNLIPTKNVQLTEWEQCLKPRFPSVWLSYSEILARAEGQSKGSLNELVIEEGDDHVDVFDRPTIINEYEPNEIEALRMFVGEPRQFFAIDYTDVGLLRRVLFVLLQHEGPGRILVEDENGNVVLLEAFLAVNQSGSAPPS